MYCEAGAAQLNTVHELWRHNSMQERPLLLFWMVAVPTQAAQGL